MRGWEMMAGIYERYADGSPLVRDTFAQARAMDDGADLPHALQRLHEANDAVFARIDGCPCAKGDICRACERMAIVGVVLIWAIETMQGDLLGAAESFGAAIVGDVVYRGKEH